MVTVREGESVPGCQLSKFNICLPSLTKESKKLIKQKRCSDNSGARVMPVSVHFKDLRSATNMVVAFNNMDVQSERTKTQSAGDTAETRANDQGTLHQAAALKVGYF